MKNTLEWHKRCFESCKKYTHELFVRYKNLQKEVADNQERNSFYEKQILEAEKRGMKEFDRDKLLKKRGEK